MIAITIQIADLKAKIRQLLEHEQQLRARGVAIFRDQAPETGRPRVDRAERDDPDAQT